jgi:hypothetical protein
MRQKKETNYLVHLHKKSILNIINNINMKGSKLMNRLDKILFKLKRFWESHIRCKIFGHAWCLLGYCADEPYECFFCGKNKERNLHNDR